MKLTDIAFYEEDVPEPLKSAGSFNLVLSCCKDCNKPFVSIQPSNRGQVSIVSWSNAHIHDQWAVHENCPVKQQMSPVKHA